MIVTSCQFNATLSGVGDFFVGSATVGHTTPENSNVTNGKTYTYYAQSFDTAIPPNVTAWEAGSGPYTILTHKLKRATITANSNGDLNQVNFPIPPIVDVYSSPSINLEPKIPPVGVAVQLTASNPISTISTVGVMMGMGSSFTTTLVYSSRLLVIMQGSIQTSVSEAYTQLLTYYGTGAAPSNGVAAIGTSLGNGVFTSSAAASYRSYSMTGIITGLTAGTTYWFDLLVANSSGASSTQLISNNASIMEL